MTLTQEYLKSRLRYEPETGHFYWIGGNNYTHRFLNKLAGFRKANGYIAIGIRGKEYFAHRLAWFYVRGVWPIEIDHINRIRNDNRIINLRLCTRSQNLISGSDRKRKVNLPRGVHKNKNRYQARLTFEGQFHNLGSFLTVREAADAYQAKRNELLGEFA